MNTANPYYILVQSTGSLFLCQTVTRIGFCCCLGPGNASVWPEFLSYLAAAKAKPERSRGPVIWQSYGFVQIILTILVRTVD